MATVTLARKRPAPSNARTNIAVDGVHVGQFFISHQAAIDLYDVFAGEDRAPFMPKNIQPLNWKGMDVAYAPTP